MHGVCVHMVVCMVCVRVCVTEHYRDEVSLWGGEEQLGKVLEINSAQDSTQNLLRGSL